MERDYCDKHSISKIPMCPKCGRYMTVDEDGFYCLNCDEDNETDEWWAT